MCTGMNQITFGGIIVENYIDWSINWHRKNIERCKHSIRVYVKQRNWKMVIVIAKELEKDIDKLKALENAKEVMECQLSEKDV